MTFRDLQAPQREVWPTLAAGVALFLAGALSVMKVSILGQSFGFRFLPLLIILIWPRQAYGVPSVIFVFLAGLFTDWGSGGVLGQWALIFTLGFGVFRPELRNDPYAPLQVFMIWLAMTGLAVLLLWVTGSFVFKIKPDFPALGRQVLLATFLLPLIIVMRRWIVRWAGDPDAWDA